jgi:Rrf2 family nitric oxide-sensitive transcriptional repressor
MKLTLFTDIALKSFLVLQSNPNKLFRIDDIAEAIAAPRNHLVKVLNFMVRKEWIRSIRGCNGGIIYNDQSDNLKLGELIRILEKDDKEELLNCAECKMNTNCRLRGLLGNATNTFYAYLNQYTLNDLSTVGITTSMIKNKS